MSRARTWSAAPIPDWSRSRWRRSARQRGPGRGHPPRPRRRRARCPGVGRRAARDPPAGAVGGRRRRGRDPGVTGAHDRSPARWPMRSWSCPATWPRSVTRWRVTVTDIAVDARAGAGARPVSPDHVSPPPAASAVDARSGWSGWSCRPVCWRSSCCSRWRSARSRSRSARWCGRSPTSTDRTTTSSSASCACRARWSGSWSARRSACPAH